MRYLTNGTLPQLEGSSFGIEGRLDTERQRQLFGCMADRQSSEYGYLQRAKNGVNDLSQ